MDVVKDVEQNRACLGHSGCRERAGPIGGIDVSAHGNDGRKLP
jgi:hypothetical protein